jgi:regulator of PEP synthase PpsR (kinase-PPPase family)
MSHTIYIVSGGAGTSGEQLVHTVLAQFPDSQVRVVVFPHVRTDDQLEGLIASAGQQQATVVHTLVDDVLRSDLVQRCAQEGVFQIDLMGSLTNAWRG